MRFHVFLFVCALVLFAAQSCKKECHDRSNPDCENYDPCYGQEPVTAQIRIAQYFPNSSYPDMRNVSVEEDKLIPGFIKFSCLTANAECTWTLGSETITATEFVRTFDDTLTKGTYTVTLIVKKAPNTSCFPNDDGIDTLTKTFELVPVCKTLTIGVFKGIWEGQTDSAIFSIRPVDYFNPNDSCYPLDFRFTNLWQKNDSLFKSLFNVYQTNTTLAVRDIGELSISRLDMKVNPVTLSTTLQFNAGTNGPFKKFTGRRIAD